jgi:hypothetical protein
MPEPIIVPLRSRRRQRAQLMQNVQHIIPGMVLLLAGVQTLGEGPHGLALALAVFQILASVLLIGSTAKKLHTSRHLFRRAGGHHVHHGAHHGIEWGEVFAAAVMVAEGLERKMHGHHFPRPIYLSVAGLLVLALFHGRIQHFAENRRALKVSDEGLTIGGRPFKARRIDARWADIVSIEVGDRYATITTRAGRTRKLDLHDLEGAEHVRHALERAQLRLSAPDMAE